MSNRGNALWHAFQDGCKFAIAGSDRIFTMRCQDAGAISLPFWPTPEEPTIWLAVFCDGKQCEGVSECDHSR